MNNEQNQPPVEAQPQPENQPAPQPTPVNPMFTAPSPTDPATPPQKKSKKLLIIILAAIVALLAIAAVVFFLFFYPRLHAESIASNFMTAIKNNDDAKMKTLSGDGGDALTQRIHDGLNNATYKISSVDKETNGFDVHFAVTNSSVLNTVTIAVEKDQVTNVVSTSKTPADDTATTTPETDTTPVAKTPTTCLSVADLNSLSITGFDPITSSEQTLDSYYFQPDLATYDTGYLNDVTTETDLYTKFGDKAFTFSLRGSVNQAASTSGGVEIAQDRVAKVQSDLIAAGIPASRITVDDPIYSSGADEDPTIFRTVTLFISCNL